MAYVIQKAAIQKNKLPYLPLNLPLKDNKEDVILDWYNAETDFDQVFTMMTHAVDEGQSYPQDQMDEQHFKDYYLSHDTFVARHLQTKDVVGSYYIKPNFPGRSSHIANAGFLVSPQYRNKGIGEMLFKSYLRVARDLGYEGSFFNLVYASNTGSLKLCRKLGFTEIGIVPKAGKLKGLGYVDAVQFYYDLTTLDENGVPVWGWPS